MRYTAISILAMCLLLVAFSSAQAERKSQVLDQYNQGSVYVVKKGDWLSKIAANYELEVEKLAHINGIEDPDKIYPGQELVIPAQGEPKSAPKQEKRKKQETQNKQKIVEKEEENSTYTVQAGDTVWGISQKFGISQSALVDVNNISNPSLIREGEELRIPAGSEEASVETDERKSSSSSGVFRWKNPGADPFTDDPENLAEARKAMHLLGFSKDQASRITQEMRNADSQTSYLQKGDKLGAMVFGSGRVEKPVVCAFEGREPVEVYTTPTLDELGYALVVPETCGNFSLIRKAPPQKPEKKRRRKKKSPAPESETGPPSVSGTFPSPESDGPSFPEVPTHPGTPGESEEDGIEHSKFDAYMGGGYSEPVHSSGHDQHAWGKARYRPLWTEVGSMDVGIGGFLYGAMGSGENGDYSHDWRKFAIGPNVKVVGECWDIDLDLGVGTMTNEGDEGKYQSEQDDDFWYVSSYASFYKRRNEGKQWLPKTSIGLEATIPFNTDHNHSWDGNELVSDPWDNKVVKASLKQRLYDFNLNGFRLTPEVHAGLGHSWGEDADFYKIGPAISAGYEGYDVLTVSALNYQEYLGSDADNLQWFGLTLDVGNAYRAWKASKIEKVN